MSNLESNESKCRQSLAACLFTIAHLAEMTPEPSARRADDFSDKSPAVAGVGVVCETPYSDKWSLNQFFHLVGNHGESDFLSIRLATRQRFCELQGLLDRDLSRHRRLIRVNHSLE